MSFEPAHPIRRISLHSSNVVSVGHDPASGVMEVEYRGGSVYRYADVSPETYEAVTRSPSVGAALAQIVRGHHPHLLIPQVGQEAPAPEDAPPPPVPPLRERRLRVGPKPPPIEARIDPDDPETAAIRRPEERLADGTVRHSGRPCAMCGLPTFPDPDDARSKAGVMRCHRGHVEMSHGADAASLEADRRW